MRLRSKLGERARAVLSSEDPSQAGEPAPPAGPRAVYARVLDGDSLWLAVVGTEERVALRHEVSGEVVEPDNDAPADPAAASYRWHLPSALPDLAETDDHDVFVLVTTGSGTQVRAEDLPPVAPMRTPPTRDGRWQLDVRRREDGTVVVRRERRAPVAEVTFVDDDPDGQLVVAFTAPTVEVPVMVLTDENGTVVSESAESTVSTDDDGRLTARLDPEVVPPEPERDWFLAVQNRAADEARPVPLVRPRNDAARPGFALALPIMWGEVDGPGQRERTSVWVRYQAEGRLCVQRPPAAVPEQDES
jgi:hypothetical protein